MIENQRTNDRLVVFGAAGAALLALSNISNKYRHCLTVAELDDLQFIRYRLEKWVEKALTDTMIQEEQQND